MKVVLRNAQVTVNSVDLSNHCSAVTIESSADNIDLTAFTSTGYHETAQGFKEATITASVFQDYAAGSVHRTLQALYDNNQAAPVIVVPDAAAAISATNPQFMMTGVLTKYQPLTGTVGEAATTDAEFRSGDQSGLVQLTGGMFPSTLLFPAPSLFPSD